MVEAAEQAEQELREQRQMEEEQERARRLRDWQAWEDGQSRDEPSGTLEVRLRSRVRHRRGGPSQSTGFEVGQAKALVVRVRPGETVDFAIAVNYATNLDNRDRVGTSERAVRGSERSMTEHHRVGVSEMPRRR